MTQLEKLVERFLWLPPEVSYEDIVSFLCRFGYTELRMVIVIEC